MPRIGNAPSGENSSPVGTEKAPLTGSQFITLNTIADWIRTKIQTLTNKTINLANNTLTGTTAEFNTALSDNNFATLAGSETLSSKTLTTPTIASFANATHDHDDAAGGGTLDEDALALTDVTTNNASLTKHGFLPKLSGDSSLFLNGDGEWITTPAGGSVYDSDVIMQDITTNNADSDSHGFLLKLSMNTSNFLRADGTWQAPPAGGSVYDSDILFSDITTNNASISQHGFLRKLSGDSDQYLNGDGEWTSPSAASVIYPQQIVVPVPYPSSKTGDFAHTVDTAQVFNFFYQQATPAQNDFLEYLILLQSGTWRVDILTAKSATRAIMTLSLDGGSTSIGTLDCYNATLVRNQTVSLTGISVASTGVKNFRMTAATRNASASNWYITPTYIVWTKTA